MYLTKTTCTTVTYLLRLHIPVEIICNVESVLVSGDATHRRSRALSKFKDMHGLTRPGITQARNLHRYIQ